MKPLFLTAILTFLELSTQTSNKHFKEIFSSDKRIISGSDAHRGQFPHMVSVQQNEKHICGAAIISSTWIVSAAHCYETPDDQENLVAVAGLLNQGEFHPAVQAFPIVEVVLHPDFYNNISLLESGNDIALLKLTKSLIFTELVKPIALPKPNQEFSGNALVSGWGYYNWTIEPMLPITLQYLEMSLISIKECEEIFAKLEVPHLKLHDRMVCTVGRMGKGSPCYHDSGSPLVQNGILIGIVVGGDFRCGIGLHGAPSYYTKVSKFVDFVTEHVKDISVK